MITKSFSTKRDLKVGWLSVSTEKTSKDSQAQLSMVALVALRLRGSPHIGPRGQRRAGDQLPQLDYMCGKQVEANERPTGSEAAAAYVDLGLSFRI